MGKAIEKTFRIQLDSWHLVNAVLMQRCNHKNTDLILIPSLPSSTVAGVGSLVDFHTDLQSGPRPAGGCRLLSANAPVQDAAVSKYNFWCYKYVTVRCSKPWLLLCLSSAQADLIMLLIIQFLSRSCFHNTLSSVVPITKISHHFNTQICLNTSEAPSSNWPFSCCYFKSLFHI